MYRRRPASWAGAGSVMRGRYSSRMTRTQFLAALAVVASAALPAQNRRLPSNAFDLPLYDGDLPGAARSALPEVFVQAKGDPIAIVRHVQTPDMRVFLPPKATATGAAIVIYPGGGYSILAIDHEGWAVARWLNDIGVAAVVVKYRVSETQGDAYRFPVPLLDARQAIRQVRAHATAWNIDTARVGVMGFSAGGHLASMTLTMSGESLTGENPGALTGISHAPNFGVLVYPVISMHQPWGHRGSSDNLAGKSATVEQRTHLSTEMRVTAATPPTFLVATQDDDAVPPQNSIAFYQAMMAQKIPGELHIWEKGGHGFGMLPDRGAAAREWLPTMAVWLRARGLLARH